MNVRLCTLAIVVCLTGYGCTPSPSHSDRGPSQPPTNSSAPTDTSATSVAPATPAAVATAAAPDTTAAAPGETAPTATDTPAVTGNSPEANSNSDASTTDESQQGPALTVARTDNLPSAVTLTDEDWPQYRGPRRDDISRSKGLASSWPASGPAQLWQIPLGQGYSAPTVVAGRVYVNDYDEARSVWMVRCLALDDGHEFWRYEVPKRIRPNHGITRTAPATDGGLVVSIDPKCEVHCLDSRDGSLVWKLNLPAAYGCSIPPWYNGQCPLLVNRQLILGLGGRALMAAINVETGQPIWETPNAENWPLSHASVMPLEIDGVAQYAYLTLKGAVGVDAQTGKVLWTFPWQFNTAVTTMPVPLGDGKLLLTAGYHARTVIVQVQHEGETWKAETLTALPAPTQGWNSEVQTPIVYRDHIYGVGKKQRGLWTCLDSSGAEVWTSREGSFGLGGYVLADDKFFLLEDRTGTLRMLDATADDYKVLGTAKVLSGPDVWAPPVVSHGKLLVRDLSKLVCLDISSPATGAGQTAAAALPPATNTAAEQPLAHP